MRDGKWITVILVILMIAGLSMALYPSVSDYINIRHQNVAIDTYSGDVSDLDTAKYEEFWEEAAAYNKALGEGLFVSLSQEERMKRYSEVLDVTGTGIMGYVDIPAVGIALSIYHGTEEDVLQKAAGHIDWSSLPVGGESSHCVISGHTGLPSAKLFTDLEKVRTGDVFFLSVLNEVLTYQVDQILVVLPEEVDDLRIEYGQDLCTLVTCTPYGVNSHRLLVRGHRIETEEEFSPVNITTEAMRIETYILILILLIPLLLLVLAGMSINGKDKNKDT